MEKQYIEVYSHASNSGIVRMPGRKYPGAVIQGDTLSTIYSRLLYILEKTEAKVDEETFLNILEIAEDIESHLLHYRKTLTDHGIKLPFVINDDRNTHKYKKYWKE